MSISTPKIYTLPVGGLEGPYTPAQLVTAMKELAKTMTIGELRVALQYCHDNGYSWVNVDTTLEEWVKKYGFKEGPNTNEFGEVCP